jgi:hypothetical protein
MERTDADEYIAECYWVGVTPSDLRALDQRIVAVAAELSDRGESVRYLGSLLLAEDEVVFCRFEGSEESVRRAAERAAVPFERILRARHASSAASPPGGPPGADQRR